MKLINSIIAGDHLRYMLALLLCLLPGMSMAAPRTWDGGGGDALAGNPANWSPDVAPIAGDDVILDATTSKAMTWDLDIPMGTWTQAGYLGTVTVATVYGPSGFTNLVIQGDCTISNGIWTHNGNAATEANLLRATIGGNLIIGANAVIDVTGKGYSAGKGPGSGTGASHGGRGGGAGPCYGSIVMPTSLGSGGFSYAGGGAVFLAVAGNIRNDGCIFADGMPTTTGLNYPGAGGSIYLVSGSLLGGGAIRTKGGRGVGFSAYGGGGRIALVMTNADADFGAYTGSILALAGDNAGSAGTIYMEKADDAPGHGELIVNNSGGASYADMNGIEAATYEFSHITLTNAGVINIGSDDTLVATNTVFVCSGANNGIRLSGGTLLVHAPFVYSNFHIRISASGATFNPGTSMTIAANAVLYVDAPHVMTTNVSVLVKAGGTINLSAPLTPLLNLQLGDVAGSASAIFNTTQTIVSNLVVLTNGILTMNRPCVVGNDFTVRAGGMATHSANTTDEVNKIDVIVRGNVSVETNGAIDVSTKGYAPKKGPSTGNGASHGGRGQNGGPCYGSIVTPTNLGSGGLSYAGGGAIRLIVSGELKNDGLICADGAPLTTGFNYPGSGGSINLNSGVLLGNGIIRTKGGRGSGFSTTGGGGRIALVVTNAGADFTSYTGSILAPRGDGSAGAGTIYKKRAADRRGHGMVVVDNDVAGYTDVPPGPPNVTNEVEFVAFHITNAAVLRLTSDYLLGDIWLDSANAKLDLGSKTLTVRSREHALGLGTVINPGAIIWWPYVPKGTIYFAK